MSNNRTGKGGNYEQARKAIANEIMNVNGNINTLIQNGVIRDYATSYTKKQVQKFLRSEDVHEVNTIDTQVIPFDVNNRYNHDGGVSETKKAEKSVNKCAK